MLGIGAKKKSEIKWLTLEPQQVPLYLLPLWQAAEEQEPVCVWLKRCVSGAVEGRGAWNIHFSLLV